MSSRCRRKNEPQMFTGRGPRFFKVVLEEDISNGNLMIPLRFAEKYGSALRDSVLLKVATGAEWRVKLRKGDGEVWLQRGWKEFAEYYSLAYGYFVIFEYKGNCQFRVFIFDMSALEIGYPFGSTNDGPEPDHDGAVQRQECKKDTEKDVHVHCKRRHESPLSRGRVQKKIKANSIDQIKVGAKAQTSLHAKPERFRRIPTRSSVKAPDVQHSFPCKGDGGRKSTKPGEGFSPPGFSRTMKRLDDNEKANALYRSIAFKSKNPFFKVAMQPSFVQGTCTLHVPSWFAKNYFPMKRANITLGISNGRTWPATYYCYQKTGWPVASIRQWKVFVHDNCLQVGDVCVFELIDITQLSFKVVIFGFL